MLKRLTSTLLLFAISFAAGILNESSWTRI